MFVAWLSLRFVLLGTAAELNRRRNHGPQWSGYLVAGQQVLLPQSIIKRQDDLRPPLAHAALQRSQKHVPVLAGITLLELAEELLGGDMGRLKEPLVHLFVDFRKRIFARAVGARSERLSRLMVLPPA